MGKCSEISSADWELIYPTEYYLQQEDPTFRCFPDMTQNFAFLDPRNQIIIRGLQHDSESNALSLTNEQFAEISKKMGEHVQTTVTPDLPLALPEWMKLAFKKDTSKAEDSPVPLISLGQLAIIRVRENDKDQGLFLSERGTQKALNYAERGNYTILAHNPDLPMVKYTTAAEAPYKPRYGQGAECNGVECKGDLRLPCDFCEGVSGDNNQPPIKGICCQKAKSVDECSKLTELDFREQSAKLDEYIDPEYPFLCYRHPLFWHEVISEIEEPKKNKNPASFRSTLRAVGQGLGSAGKGLGDAVGQGLGDGGTNLLTSLSTLSASKAAGFIDFKKDPDPKLKERLEKEAKSNSEEVEAEKNDFSKQPGMYYYIPLSVTDYPREPTRFYYRQEQSNPSGAQVHENMMDPYGLQQYPPFAQQEAQQPVPGQPQQPQAAQAARSGAAICCC